MESNLGLLALGSYFFGVFSHLTWFIRGEHFLLAPRYFVIATCGPSIATAFIVYYLDFSIFRALQIVAVCYTCFFAGLFSSITIYRRLFHPLRAFPGPPEAIWSQLWHVSKVISKADNFKHLDRLHAQYGEYVRIGPNLLSIADPDWVEPIHNPHTKFIKSDWYDGGHPLTTLHQMRDKTMHDARRRHGWDKAFTTKSLRAYDKRQLKYTDQLVSQIKKRSGEVVNATAWLNYFSFDVMGDLAFGRSFEALEKGQTHFYIDLIHNSGIFPGVFGTAPWIMQILMLIPKSWSSMGRMLLYSEECVEDRKTYTPKEPDVMSHILEAGEFFPNDKKREQLLLTGDSRLLIVAGSDTTATTLVYCFYHLAKDPSLAEKLRAEMLQYNISNKNFEVQPLQYLPYLNALINETLRMHPPVPGGVFRDTPAEGVEINGVRLPGGVKIIGPHYTIQRSPRAFVNPNDFVPERWTSQPDLVLNKNAFFPFSMGRFSCIGKQLALNELRTVISKMVLEFDVAFAPGENGQKLLEESQDTFTMSNAELKLVWKVREKAE